MTHEDTYLCMLDWATTDADSIDFGKYKVRRLSESEIRKLLRGCDDPPISKLEEARFSDYSQCPWIVWNETRGVGELEEMLARCGLAAQDAYAGCEVLIADLLRPLNLLKAAAAPIRPIQYYMRPAGHVQTGHQIQRVIYNEPESPGTGPPPASYSIKSEDADLYRTFKPKYDKLKSGQTGAPPADHLRIADELFRTADRNWSNRTGETQSLVNLMLYDATIEALLLSEDKHGEGVLAGRAQKMVSPTQAGEFVRKLFRIRSKTGHGSMPIEELLSLIEDKPNVGMPEEPGTPRKRISDGPYASLFLSADTHPQPFLVNVRELARHAICYFIDELDAGRRKDQTLAKLSPPPNT